MFANDKVDSKESGSQKEQRKKTEIKPKNIWPLLIQEFFWSKIDILILLIILFALR
jgi:hypothetical protein